MNNNQIETHKPHIAMISIETQVHSLLPTGECSGRIVNKDVLNQYGIQDKFLITINGINLDDCLKKLAIKLKEFKNDNVEPE